MTKRKRIIFISILAIVIISFITLLCIFVSKNNNKYKYSEKIYEDSYDYKTNYGYLYLKETNETQRKLYEDLYLKMIDFSHKDIDLNKKTCRSIFYKEKIDNNTLTFDEISQVYIYINIENPKFYWIDDDVKDGYYYIGVNEEYIKSSVRKEISKKIEEGLKVSDNLVKDIDDEFIKLKTIYDYIVGNMTFVDTQKIWEHNIVGFYDRNEGVCETYSKVFKFLCDRYNIDNIPVVSADHIWNLVEYNNYWYVFDLTWDNGRYAYFGKTEEIYVDSSISDDSHEYDSKLYKLPDNIAITPLSFGSYELKEDGNTICISHSLDYIYTNFNNGNYKLKLTCSDSLATKFYFNHIDSNYNSLVINSTKNTNQNAVLELEKDITLNKDIRIENMSIRSPLIIEIKLNDSTLYLKNVDIGSSIDIEGNVIYLD